MDWNWPSHAQGMGIGQLATREQPQPARDHGLELASSCLGNGNWPACDQGTGLASVGLEHGIGQHVTREQHRLARDQGQDMSCSDFNVARVYPGHIEISL